jgi:hypothetical protein
MTKRVFAVAAVATALMASGAHAEQWWLLYRSDPSTGVLDSCRISSPAKGFADLSLLGYTPSYEPYGDDEVDVVFKQEPNGHEHAYSYFRTLDDCKKAAQVEIDNANKYR